MILRLPRHLAIAMSAALVGYLAMPFESGVLAALVSAFVWLGFSLLLRRPRVQQWIILGFFSPFVGGVILGILLVFVSGRYVSLPDLAEGVALGLAAVLMVCWYAVPVGVGMGLVAAFLSRAFSPLEAGSTSKSPPAV